MYCYLGLVSLYPIDNELLCWHLYLSQGIFWFLSLFLLVSLVDLVLNRLFYLYLNSWFVTWLIQVCQIKTIHFLSRLLAVYYREIGECLLKYNNFWKPILQVTLYVLAHSIYTNMNTYKRRASINQDFNLLLLLYIKLVSKIEKI